MSQSSLIARKGGPSNGDRRQANTEDDIIPIPDCDINDVKERFRLTLIGRVFHLRGRSTEALIHLLPRPRIWNVEGRVRGLNLGNGRFQFDFNNETDLQMVLNKRPCHFNQWSFALERWEPLTSENFPNTIPFWITVTGVPVHFWNDKTFTQIANALGKKLSIDSTKARIHVSIEADKPLQFERRIDFPNGDIGKVTLTYEGLHRYCFTCKHISHDENSCPLLTPEERDLKRKQRAESYANDDYARLPSQSTQGYNSRSSLKRPRSPPSGRHLSPPSSPRNNRKLHDDKRRKSITSSFSTHQTRASEYSNKDRTNSGRLENRQPHDSNEVWSRLALPYRREGTDRRRNDQLYSRSKSHHENSQKGRNSTYEWRPRRHNEAPRNRAPTTREPHSGPYDREEKSRATYDSQKTISDNRVSLESGEIDTNRRHEAATATTERETEEERTRRLKGKAIATGSPSPQEKAAHLASLAARGTSLMIREAPAAPTHRTPYTSPRYDSNQTKQADKPLDNEFGLDLDLDMPMTDLELAEVDNLVLETERLEMDENMMDNDDLLGDSPAYDAEQIEAISQLSPAITGSPRAPPSASLAPPAASVPKTAARAQPNPYIPKGLLKKKAPRSPDIKGANASKKLLSLKSRASPKKKATSGKYQAASSTMVLALRCFLLH